MTIYTDIQQNKFITPNLGRATNSRRYTGIYDIYHAFFEETSV